MRPERGGTIVHKRWAFRPYKQFDLVRTDDGGTYLTRWWLLATPWGGLCLHRMQAGDARDVVHDHPFTFLSIVLRGGYIQRRLDPLTMTIRSHRVNRLNLMRRGDAHTITRLTRTPTWTLLLVGAHRRTWGFWEPSLALPDWEHDSEGGTRRSGGIGASHGEWRWTQHDSFDSGHYVPEPTR